MYDDAGTILAPVCRAHGTSGNQAWLFHNCPGNKVCQDVSAAWNLFVFRLERVGMGLLLCVRHGFVLRGSTCLGGWSTRYDTVSFVISSLGYSVSWHQEYGMWMAVARNMFLFHLERVGMRLLR